MNLLIIFVANRHNDKTMLHKLQIMKIVIVFLTISLLSCNKQMPTYRDLNQNGKMDIYEDPSQTIETRVNDILSRLATEDKINLVTGTGMHIPQSFGGIPAMEPIGNSYMIVPGAAGTTFPFDSLGIPATILADGPAGLRIQPKREDDSTQTFYCTAFPVARLLASSWDTALLESVGESMGNEVLEYGVDVLLGPGMNIHRNPLGGRNFEYYSEDPLISGKMAAAMVNGVESNGVGTSIKHYVANNQETNRFNVNTIISNRALREIYLRSFEIAVKESQPWTVMSSYNRVNGEYTSESNDLLTKVLRDDWGFKGIVMTDWLAGADAALQMNAGNDLLMPGRPDQRDRIKEALQSGDLTEDVLDTNAKRILTYILNTRSFSDYDYSNHPDLQKHAEVARQAATQGMVLLKNDDKVLPFGSDIKSVAAFGITSYEIITGGTGSGDVNEAYSISLVQGLEDAGLTLNSELKTTYEDYITKAKAERPPKQGWFMPETPLPELVPGTETVTKSLGGSDIALITIGRGSGEFNDIKLSDYYLSDAEKSLIKKVSGMYHQNGRKVAVALNIGQVIEVESWKDDVDAILLMWQPGQEAGHAVADILTGKVNPSGKLATTFPKDYTDVPSSDNFPGTPPDMPEEVKYDEGIYVGYRYYLTQNVPVSYEFGYGLSYTTFEYSNLQLGSDVFEDSLQVSVDITNSGNVAGKEVVEMYISAPQGNLDKPTMELRGFAKTKLLTPGEKQTIAFTIHPRDLTSFDEATSTWVADKGTYAINIGASCLQIKEKGTFELNETLSVEKVTAIFASQK